MASVIAASSEGSSHDASPGRTALLTGATGFVGLHLAAYLSAAGWTVHALVRETSHVTTALERCATIHRSPLNTSRVFEIVRTTRPDVVFHLASLFITQHRAHEVPALVESNISFPTCLIDAMAAHGVRRLVNTGTSWQHFEDADYDPVNLYAATKQAFEAMLQFYVSTANLSVITLNLFDTYGPNDPRRKIFTLFRDALASGTVLQMSPGEQLLDLVYIDDVNEAFRLAGERLLQDRVIGHERYSVTSGSPTSLKRVVELYESVLGRRLPIEWGGRPYRAREVMSPWSRGSWLPGWKPTTSLADGLARIVRKPEASQEAVRT